MPKIDFLTRNAQATPAGEQFAHDVQYYLTQQPRQLPSRYLYDALGSALFDAICRMPWYGVTRAELRLLDAHAGKILALARPFVNLVELGPGSGEKLARLIEAAPAGRDRPHVYLVDVSPSALALATRTLRGLDEELRIVTREAPYEAGLRDVMGQARNAGRSLVLFLGSNIGNFDRPATEAFLRGVRAALSPGDVFLMGADLVKPEADLLLAYDDPLGITAAFNRNLLYRINRELGGDFDVPQFAHRAVWNAEESRVEMHLVALRRQRVHVAAAGIDITLEAGETIWTESSYKFRPDDIERRLRQTGFSVQRQWIDADDGFALTAASAV